MAVRALSSSGAALSEPEDLDSASQATPPVAPDGADVGAADLTPSRVVELLDRHIVGQPQAKRAVAVALRNRWRRRQIEEPMKSEIVPKNILMIGPTGCGKTEIARRLAKLVDAPFVKVEATKFTEVGFHGRDVDQIIRDLLENAILLQRTKMRARVETEVARLVEDQVLDALIGPVSMGEAGGKEQRQGGVHKEQGQRVMAERETFRGMLRRGELDERRVQVDLPISPPPSRGLAEMGSNPSAFMDTVTKHMDRMIRGQRSERRELRVSEARQLLTELESEKLLSSEAIVKDAIQVTESEGIVFIDEIDKIVSSSELRHGADASAEGVQRDLLPIIEGSVVSTKHGNVNTQHILFVCSGAFHSCKPSDMLAELQGRLPIRVELKGLSEKDLYRILTEPEANMIQQQQILMRTEGIDLVFTDAAIQSIAANAAEVNRMLHNIGARRLHTVIERVVEDISFHAPERCGEQVVVEKEDVSKALGDLIQREDLSRYIL